MKTILIYTSAPKAAQQEIIKVGGTILQLFTPKLMAVNLPEDVNPNSLKHATTEIHDKLKGTAKLAAEAWVSFQDKNKSIALAPDATKGLSWDTEGYQPPREMRIENSAGTTTAMVHMSAAAPTSAFMIGSIAVGVVIVSGPGALRFTEQETKQVISEVQEGLHFLATLEPRANISFVYDLQIKTVNVKAGSTTDFETAEAPWRNAALQKMGFSANRQGSIDYVNRLRSSKQTRWAYVAYFTKYPLHHFAYAEGEKVVMDYKNDGWGPKNINAVFAHETCHIFGAADEYAESRCNCSERYGHLKVPNANCKPCAGTAFTPCLMEKNDLVMCVHTRRQIGWDESLFP
ncbi:MAG: hypothetical protein JNM68_16745 [Dinghuibacter sp.]|nr:hypothetical protein [Dinghuibacter sp.]